MTYRWPMLERIQFEETPERLRVTLPAGRKWPFLILYTGLMIVWVAALVWGIVALFSTPRGALGGTGLAVWIGLILLLLYLWFRLGGFIWRWWQYYLAQEEQLFIDGEVLLVRRPFSIFGVTDAYDMRHVAPFFYSEKHGSLAFRYGNKGILFGESLTAVERDALLKALNGRFFPHYDDD